MSEHTKRPSIQFSHIGTETKWPPFCRRPVRCIFNGYFCISIKIPLEFITMIQKNTKQATNHYPNPCRPSLFTNICVTRCRWVKLNEAESSTYASPKTWAVIGSDNDLSPVRRQAIMCTNAILLSIGPVAHRNVSLATKTDGPTEPLNDDNIHGPQWVPQVKTDCVTSYFKYLKFVLRSQVNSLHQNKQRFSIENLTPYWQAAQNTSQSEAKLENLC